MDYRVDNINKKEFSSVQNDSKESFYLTQLSNSTTLILSVIGFALVLASISSFFIIRERFEIFDSSTNQKITTINNTIKTFKDVINTDVNTFKTEIKNQIVEYNKKHKDVEHSILELKNDLNFEASVIKSNEANKALSYGDFENFLFYSLYSNNYKKKCLSHYKENDKNGTLHVSLLESINSNLEYTLTTLKSSPNFEENGNKIFINSDSENVMMMINSINKLEDENIFKTLSSIYNILEFKKAE